MVLKLPESLWWLPVVPSHPCFPSGAWRIACLSRCLLCLYRYYYHLPFSLCSWNEHILSWLLDISLVTTQVNASWTGDVPSVSGVWWAATCPRCSEGSRFFWQIRFKQRPRGRAAGEVYLTWRKQGLCEDTRKAS